MSSTALSETEQLMFREFLIDPPRLLSETPKRTFDFLDGLDRTNSSNDFKWSFRIPVDPH